MRRRIFAEVGTAYDAQVRLAAANTELARSNEDLERFAYVASHDLQEPLRKVASFCQLLEQRYSDQLDDRGRQYIAFAVDGAKRMQVLINDLLAFSRIGRTTERFEEVSLDDCLELARHNLAAAVEATGADVRASTELPTVSGDRSLLVALLQNLIGNAIKFHGDATPEVEVAAQTAEGQWLMSVSDNGIGIEPRFAERIFVIFQRLHGREAYTGTGIGLAMCRKIVEFHGGRIWLDTDHRPGTRFFFTLPQIRTEENPDDRDAPEPADPTGTVAGTG
jgi:light-regulated signal transduction histidine kinase (bacteriophytochrome)